MIERIYKSDRFIPSLRNADVRLSFLHFAGCLHFDEIRKNTATPRIAAYIQAQTEARSVPAAVLRTGAAAGTRECGGIVPDPLK